MRPIQLDLLSPSVDEARALLAAFFPGTGRGDTFSFASSSSASASAKGA